MSQLEASRKHLPFEDMFSWASAPILMLLFAVVIPRLALIGSLPATDEGVYAYHAQLLHASLSTGSGLPDAGPLRLYPLLLNWVFAFDVNPLIALRLADMLVAVAAGYALLRVTEIESGSRIAAILLSLLVLFAMNQPVFIQYGFKNSMFASFVPLFTALWLGLSAPAGYCTRRWIAIGALLSLGALLRETFVPFVVVGAFSVLFNRGFRPFLHLILGGILGGLSILGPIVAARGGIASLLEGYQSSAQIYAAMTDKRGEYFLSSALQFINEAKVVLVIAGVGLIVTLIRSVGNRSVKQVPRLIFWLMVALVPFIEPASKIGFPYHFSASLPGLAGLAALGWRTAFNDMRGQWLYQRLACGALAIAIMSMFIPRAHWLWANWQQSKEMLANFQTVRWPETYTNKSNYLLASEVIRQFAPSGGTIAVSGYMLALYPLSGFLPPKPELENLTDTIINLDFSESRLRETLLRCPPDVVMATSRRDWPGGTEILAAVRSTGIYEEVAEISTTSNRSYGTFGGIIFRSRKQFPCQE